LVILKKKWNASGQRACHTLLFLAKDFNFSTLSICHFMWLWNKSTFKVHRTAIQRAINLDLERIPGIPISPESVGDSGGGKLEPFSLRFFFMARFS